MISINLYEIFFQCVNFVILLWLIQKFFAKPMGDFLQGRANRIKRDLEESESNRTESERVLAEQKSNLKSAYQDAQEIRAAAEEANKKERSAAVSQAKKDAKQIVDAAKKEIDVEVGNAKKALAQQVGTLSISLTEKLLKKSIDASENQDIINEYVGRLSN